MEVGYKQLAEASSIAEVLAGQCFLSSRTEHGRETGYTTADDGPLFVSRTLDIYALLVSYIWGSYLGVISRVYVSASLFYSRRVICRA